MRKFLSKFGEQQLVMVNYACGFNQSETRKYFEWLIIWLKSLSWAHTISAEALSLNDNTIWVWSAIADSRWRDRLIRCFGGNKPWNGRVDKFVRILILVEKTIISVDHILQKSSANWVKVEMHDQASFLTIHVLTGHLHGSCIVAGGQYLWNQRTP